MPVANDSSMRKEVSLKTPKIRESKKWVIQGLVY